MGFDILCHLFPFDKAFELFLFKKVAFGHFLEIFAPLLSDILPSHGSEVKLLHICINHV